MWRTGLFSGALRDWPTADVVRVAADAGFRELEWEVAPGGHIRLENWEGDARARHADTVGARLEVCAVSASNAVSLLDEASVRAVVGAARTIGAPLARFFAPPFDPDRRVDDQLEAVLDSLARHARSDAGRDVAVIVELSEETLVPSPELLVRVCSGLDPQAVGCLYDPANMLVEGNLEPTFALRILGPYLRHVHVKNEAFVREDGRGWAPRIVPLREGLVDWARVLGALAERRYEGSLVIDHLSAPETGEQVAEEHRTLRRLLDEVVRR
jgi:sugar phosphate isomerase/epimerase